MLNKLFQSGLTSAKRKGALRHKKRELKEDEGQFKSQIFEKFLSTINNKRKKYLKSRLGEYYGKNFAIKYKQHFDFAEQWQNEQNQPQNPMIQLTNLSNPLQIVFSLLRLFVYIVTLWFSSVQFFVKTQGSHDIYQYIYMIAIGVQLLDLLVKFGKYGYYKSSEMKLVQLFKISFNNLLSIVYLSLKFETDRRGTNKMAAHWTILQLIAILLIYQRTSQLYQSLRLMSFAIHYQYQSKLIDLLSTLIIMAHFIALILYFITTIDIFQTNWLSVINISNPNNEFIIYLYAFYFGSTTILTVGYGDISPKNPVEIGVVTLIQIFGIVMYAYLINQIGYSISSIRKERESTQRDLSTLQKLKKHYKMKDSLLYRARSSIINHKPNADQLAPQQQNALLLKFNENLRNDISKKNMITVVKSSLFLVIRWSKVFQTAVSVRLIHILYSPNDIILQKQGAQKLMIVRSGKIQIYAQASASQKIKKLLKTVQNTLDKQIGDNCYGFTSIISRRRPRLYAITKDFISAYYIDKHNFQQCLRERVTDFEYYHQIKSKIDQAHLPQATEIQSFQSSKQHYAPTRIYVIQKNVKVRTKSPRRQFIRNVRDYYRGSKNMGDVDFIRHLRNKYFSSFESHHFQTTEPYDKVLEIDPVNRRDIISEQSQFQQFVRSDEVRRNIHHFFESSKQYSNYFPKCNQTKVLQQYQNQACSLGCDKDKKSNMNEQIYQSMLGHRASFSFQL